VGRPEVSQPCLERLVETEAETASVEAGDRDTTGGDEWLRTVAEALGGGEDVRVVGA